MKQHAIPQNILDIEFKLFTKFTVREFAYIAIGVGFGGIFLYLYSRNDMPGIIAFPVFLISSGFGLFLGVIPINDQKADVFLRNYIGAITRPTQRVWKNAQFDEKLALEAKERGVMLTQGVMSREANDQNPGSQKIIGGADLPSNQFIAQSALDQLDQEEEATLKQFDAIAQAELGTTVQPSVSQEPTAQSSPNTPQEPAAQSSPNTPQEPEMVPLTNIQEPTQPTVINASGVDVQTPQPPVIENRYIDLKSSARPPIIQTLSKGNYIQQPQVILDNAGIAAQEVGAPEAQTADASLVQSINTPQPQAVSDLTPVAPNQTVQLNQMSVQQPIIPSQDQHPQPPTKDIIITAETAPHYAVETSTIQTLPNTINIQLLDSKENVVPQVMTIIRDNSGKMLQVHQSNNEGFVLSNKSLGNGEYIVDVQDDKYTFPKVRYILNGVQLPVVKVRANN